MKKLLVFAFALSCFLPAVTQAKDKDYENEKVEVTLKSGEVVKGYLKTHWFGPMKKELNTRFSIVSEPKGKDQRKFTADDIQQVYFPAKTVENPEGLVAEPGVLAYPGVFQPNKTRLWILNVVKKGENATVYWYNDYEVVTSRTSQRRYVVTRYCFKLNDDEMVYPFSLSVTNRYLKKRNPEFKEYLNKYFEEDGKSKRKELADDPASFLKIYDAFLKSKK